MLFKVYVYVWLDSYPKYLKIFEQNFNGADQRSYETHNKRERILYTSFIFDKR